MTTAYYLFPRHLERNHRSGLEMKYPVMLLSTPMCRFIFVEQTPAWRVFICGILIWIMKARLGTIFTRICGVDGNLAVLQQLRERLHSHHVGELALVEGVRLVVFLGAVYVVKAYFTTPVIQVHEVDDAAWSG